MSENNMKFQPISKRFMVWNKIERYFCYNHDGSHIFNIHDLAVFFINKAIDGAPHGRFEVIQSTNLFDKDGKEIFEGSIVGNDYGWIGVAVQYKGQWIINYRKATPVTVWHLLYDIKNDIKLIDHILSNPELLEEK